MKIVTPRSLPQSQLYGRMTKATWTTFLMKLSINSTYDGSLEVTTFRVGIERKAYAVTLRKHACPIYLQLLITIPAFAGGSF